MKLKTCFSFINLFLLLFASSGCSPKKIIVSYSLYPYLLDSEHYQFIVENEWKKIRPDVDLKFVEYNCYHDGEPKDIDVVMYDSCLENDFVEKGYLQPIEKNDINQSSDFLSFTIDDIYKNGKLYGIPAILCANFLIFDKNSKIAEDAVCIEDLAQLDKKLVANVDYNYLYFYNDYLMDKSGQYKQSLEPIDVGKTTLQYFRNISNKNYLDVSTYLLAEPYNKQECDAYYGYSETLSLIGDRISSTDIKTISMTNNKDVPLYFEDIVGINSSVGDDKKSLCLELMNLISSKDVMDKVNKNNNEINYLIFPRKSFYSNEIVQLPIYQKLFNLLSNTDNHIFR